MKKIIDFWKALPTLGKVCLVIAFLALYSILFGMYEWHRGYRDCEKNMTVDTTEQKTVIKWDTTFVDKPVPVQQWLVRVEHDTVPVTHYDTVDNTAVIEIPITRKVYSDSLYRAVISGYKPSLDSIDIYQKTVTHTQTITKTVTDKRKWAIGLQGGYGYGLKSKDFQPFIGVGISYRIF